MEDRELKLVVPLLSQKNCNNQVLTKGEARFPKQIVTDLV